MSPSRLEIVEPAGAAPAAPFAHEVREGLTSDPKELACRYFYDAEGSRLFEAICELPEYYLPKAEREILTTHASDIVSRVPKSSLVFELGSGNAAKTRLLLESFLRQGPTTYVPVDISSAALRDSARALVDAYPTLSVKGIVGEYEQGLRWLEGTDGARLVLWLGSNIGNLDRDEAAAFLRRVGRALTRQDRMLVGVDLRKDKKTLEAAYDDTAGVTAQFNKNLLVRINRELGGQFELDAFQHRATYDEKHGRIDMYLVSARAQSVRIAALDVDVRFSAGEAIHTESSYKYSPDELGALVDAAGLRIDGSWLDSGKRFAELLLAAP